LFVSGSGSEGLCVLVDYVTRFWTLNANARITDLRCAESMMKEVRANCTKYRRKEGTVSMKCSLTVQDEYDMLSEGRNDRKDDNGRVVQAKSKAQSRRFNKKCHGPQRHL
jgi:hypothetical protein